MTTIATVTKNGVQGVKKYHAVSFFCNFWHQPVKALNTDLTDSTFQQQGTALSSISAFQFFSELTFLGLWSKMNAVCPLLFVITFVQLVFTAPANKEEEFNVHYLDMDSLDAELDYEYEDELQETKQIQLKEIITSRHDDTDKSQEVELSRFIRSPTIAPEPDNPADMPTCLLCVCLTGSVYCDETEIEEIPILPKETSYIYARFNNIKRVTVKDFADFPTLRGIDLSGNQITEIEDKVFAQLPELEYLTLTDNRLTRLPALPPKLITLDAQHNRIKSNGIKRNAFKNLARLQYLYLGYNKLDKVPDNLPQSIRVLHLQHNNISSITDNTFCKPMDASYIRDQLTEIRLEENPINLAEYPNSYICLRRLPIGKPYFGRVHYS
ncbi:osteoglycin, paralog a [Hypanus sabinus]|uniref:osteoglycin, paralog a n=1 Tax=Hypanus sabinus TaxID=79690 RepID=UPI0028C4C6FA|nr:osteoglycin, paralog a [Hypanus sabinus]